MPRRKGVPVKRKTVYIPVDLARQLEELADKTDVPETKIVTLALALLLERKEEGLRDALRLLKTGEGSSGEP